MTTEEARDLLLNLLAEKKYEQDSLHHTVPDSERITRMTAIGNTDAEIVFADGSAQFITVREGGQR